MASAIEDLPSRIRNFGSKSADGKVIEALERLGISLPQKPHHA